MKNTTFQLIGLMILSIALVAQDPAMAQEGKPSLVVLFADTDKLSDGEKASLAAIQKKVLEKYGKYTLMETPKIEFLDEMVNYECLEMDAACLAQIGKAQGAAFLLYTSWDGSKLVVKLVNVTSGEQVGEYVATVNKNRLSGAASEDALANILGPLPKPVKKKAAKLVTVNISANVKAAEVFINQKRIGQTPLKVKLKPGKYVFSARKEGFLMTEETVEVAGEEPIDWVAVLKPVPVKAEKKVEVVVPPAKKKIEEKEEKAFYQTWWFWTAVGLGAAAVVGGTVAALSAVGETYDVGTVRFTISPSSAEKDFLFYEPVE